MAWKIGSAKGIDINVPPTSELLIASNGPRLTQEEILRKRLTFEAAGRQVAVLAYREKPFTFNYLTTGFSQIVMFNAVFRLFLTDQQVLWMKVGQNDGRFSHNLKASDFNEFNSVPLTSGCVPLTQVTYGPMAMVLAHLIYEEESMKYYD